MKRAYKLQEFIAHTSDVNCLKIGRKSSRVLVTGGEDHKVNMWAIGKPNAILSLSGHSSAVESVTFDAAEALVVAGAASGTIKLWDLEEAKIVRTLTGHRSNCISVDFHPFGEFFASGSLDTNLKIWDIRRKGCLHTYKGHTRGIKCIKFSPDGRWVVSGSQDNTVKLWDLTAGKLMHDFKYHDGEVQCLDFHPQEFLLASGSVDKTVKFYDLETFELIGSSGPEVPGLRAMLFDPDGRSLLCAAHENLKVLSWEPLRYHDVVDVSWSKIADFNVHEEKLLGCSYNKNCVSVWVVDLVQATPLQISSASRTNAVVMAKDTLNTREQHPLKSTTPPILESPAKNAKMSSSKLKLDIHAVENFPTAPKTPRSCRVSAPANIVAQPYVLTPRKGSVTRVQSGDSNSHPIRAASDKTSLAYNGARNNHIQVELDDVRKDNSSQLQNYSAERLSQHVPEEHDTDKVDSSANVILKEAAQNRKSSTLGNHLPRKSTSCQVLAGHGEILKSTTPTANVERRSRSLNFDVPVVIYTSKEKCLEDADLNKSIMDTSSQCGDNDDTIAELLEQHINISGILQSRLTKLQIVRRFWERADFKGAIDTMKRLADNAVLCDVFSMILEGSELLTLDTFAMVIPLLNILLSSSVDRHITTAISTLSILLKSFGSIIQSTVSTSPSIGVNLQAEQRHEKCNKCFTELQAVRGTLKPLSRRKNDIGRAASDLTVALDAVC